MSWHWSLAEQTTGLAPVQAPVLQVSVWVQALPSLQVEPSALGGSEQRPVPVSQTPMSWHWSLAEQTTGLAPVQAPVWQVSVWVQALPSLQVEPSLLGGSEQIPVPVSHTPMSWHWSLAEQITGAPLQAPPAWQMSPEVHRLLSVQTPPVAITMAEVLPARDEQLLTVTVTL